MVQLDNTVGNILIIDDDFDYCNILRIHLQRCGHRIVILNQPINYIPIIEENEIDALLLDLMMPVKNGLDVLKDVRHRYPQIPVIIMTAVQSIHPAVTAMKLGAFDYIAKAECVEESDHLKLTVRNAVSIAQSLKELEKLRSERAAKYNFEQIIGISQPMKDIFEQIKKVADSNINVIIFGESGTGKELIARAIHYASQRSNGPFADLNCAAVHENLIESELFGHEKGSFTGAYARKIGKFELANGGTLFLDEVGDMPLIIQAKILRAIQERSFERVGGETKVKVDVRIISATNKNIKEEVENKNFRSDLYYRLAGFPIYLAPLRQRADDLPPLVNHFIAKFAREMNKNLKEPTAEALSALKAYSWPGNIRELENVIQRAVVLSEKNNLKLQLETLPLEIQTIYLDGKNYPLKEVLSNMSVGTEKNLSFEEIEKRVIQDALMQAKGNVSLAAEKLQIGRATMYRKIERYHLKVKK